MELDTKIYDLDDASYIGNIIAEWCRTNLKNGHKRYFPTIIYNKWNRDNYERRGDVGAYDIEEYEIYIAYDKLTTIESLIRTIIHEWTHHTQSKKLLKEDNKLPYSKRKSEQLAFEAEDKWLDNCWTNIKNKLQYERRK